MHPIAAGPFGLFTMTDPSAALPPWAPLAFGAMILVTLVVIILQAIRYFRNNRDE